MFFPFRTDVPLRRIPWMNLGLIFFNLLIFLLTTSFGAGWKAPFETYHGYRIKDALALDPQNPALWQYFTYQFLHANWMHILGNGLFLYIFGNNINDRLGHAGYLGFFLAGGVFSGVSHAMFSASPVIGASGAIAAVTGAYLVLLPRSNITVVYFFFVVGALEVPSIWFVLLNFGRDVYAQASDGSGESVAHMAHIGGTLFGAAVCMILVWVRLIPRDQFDVLALASRWHRRRQYRSMVSQGYNPFGYIEPRPADVRRVEPNPRQERILELRAEISEAIAHHNLQHAAIQFLELKKIDPAQVLSRQAQLDMANQLASQQFYEQAADAYEQFLRHYPNYEQIEQVELMLGLVYSRYLQRYDRARQLLQQALTGLHSESSIRLAREELAKVQTFIPMPGPG